MALGHCELGPDDGDDMYPELYLQGSIDELHELCLQLDEYPSIVAADSVLEDAQLQGVRTQALELSGEQAVLELLELSPEQEALVEHQSALIVGRIKPAAG